MVPHYWISAYKIGTPLQSSRQDVTYTDMDAKIKLLIYRAKKHGPPTEVTRPITKYHCPLNIVQRLPIKHLSTIFLFNSP